MKRNIVSVVCASVLLGATSMAYAGAYGETEQPEEMPQPIAAAPAAAEAEIPPPSYWYIGAGGLYSVENFHCDADNAWGYYVRAGRRFNDYVAVEALWEHPVSDYDDADKVDGHGIPDGNVDAWDITAGVRGTYPAAEHVEPYASVGGGYGEANLPHGDNNGGFVARFGIGLDFPITHHFGVTTGAAYLLGTGDMSEYDQIPISVGAFYNF